MAATCNSLAAAGCSSEGGIPGGPTGGAGGSTTTGGGGSGGSTPTGGAGGSGGVAPAPEFSFLVFGDSQFATTSCTSGVPERLALPAEMLQQAPTLLLHTGDLMDHGYEDGAYAQFVSCYADLLAATPLFPTPGNHDMGSGAIWDYKTYLEQQLRIDNAAVWDGDYESDVTIWYEDDPTDYSTDFNNPTHQDVVPSGVSFKTFYAMRYANMKVISFEQGTRWWTNTPKTWLESHLQSARADPSIEHLFVVMHHPMYSTKMEELDSGECIQQVRNHYESYFRDYDVTMVFAGHTHIYDRFYVPDDGTPTQTDTPPAVYPHDGQAVHYLVTGGAGPIPSCSPPPTVLQQYSYDYAQTQRCGHHFVRVDVHGASLRVRAIEVEGSASDYTTSPWEEFRIE